MMPFAAHPRTVRSPVCCVFTDKRSAEALRKNQSRALSISKRLKLNDATFASCAQVQILWLLQETLAELLHHACTNHVLDKGKLSQQISPSTAMATAD